MSTFCIYVYLYSSRLVFFGDTRNQNTVDAGLRWTKTGAVTDGNVSRGETPRSIVVGRGWPVGESEFMQRLLRAVGDDRQDAGIVIEAEYQAPGDSKVMPPSYPDGPYLYEPRWIGVDKERVKQQVVILDQIPSQANRVEEALLVAHDSGRVDLPIFEMRAKTSRGFQRLTSLDFPHRYADAYLRDSLVQGTRFDDSEVGRRLRMANVTDASPLFEREPGALLLGAWDSHRSGRWPKFARTYQSEMIGLEPEEGVRRGTRMDPWNLTGGVDDAAKAKIGGDWRYQPGAAKDFKDSAKVSNIGHGNIAPGKTHGGVSITGARRNAWLSLAGLERLRFGDASHEAVVLARGCLAALALAGDRLAFGRPSVWLRSGCDLIRVNEIIAFERDGGGREEFEITAGDAIAAFAELRDQAAAAGLEMASNVIAIEPIPELLKAIEYSMTKAED